MKNNKAMAYARVSTGEQAKGFSIEAQYDEIKKYCSSHSIKVIKKYNDAMSGRKLTERTGLMTMLDDVDSSSPRYIIATESDRISRNTFQFGWIDTHLSMKGVKLLLVNEKQADGPFEKAFIRIRAVFSEFETDLRQWRINRGRAKALKSNRFMNRPPFGYRMSGKNILIEEDEKLIVIKLFREFVNGASIKCLSRAVGKSPSTVRYILSNQFYSNPDINGKHPAFIKGKDFEFSLKILLENKRNSHLPVVKNRKI